jgi:hypothetical protein
MLLSACGGSTPTAVTTPTEHSPGPLGDTWFGHGATWRQAAGAHPSARYSAALAYDAARSDFVLFGGQSGSVSYDETWTFDGKAWKLRIPAHKPRPRRGAAMAYDPSLRQVVLYGGLVPDGSEGSEADDTWTWDGADWALVTGNNSGPSYRNGAQMVTAGDRVILFGGHTSNTRYYGDAWTLTGSRWVRIDHAPTPAGRGEAAAAWDVDDSSLVVYGGIGIRPNAGPGNLGLPLTDAWSLKGGAWSQLSAAGPPALYNASGVWDAATHSVVVMLGMNCPQPVNDAWAWNGSTWSHSNLPIPARWAAASAEDASGEVLVFGGDDEKGC